MGSVKVTVFGRIRPCPKNIQTQEYSIKSGENEDIITFSSSKSPQGKKSFKFQKIFNENATQEEIFRIVGKPVIEKVLSGFNGTIFTYGQTGSGKTFTMTGDIEKWEYPGLIPRTLQEIFHYKGQETVVSITYCEIYNEHVYDLIRVDRVESDLPQVSILEDSSGITHFRNLSVHIVDTIYDALQLLVVGDANKMVAETASNAKSSRSHVIFSISLDFPHPMYEKLSLKPVLYLVDLAGSEKLSKCKASSSNPWETRYINLSLHYLEQVLVALRQPGRVHIPYRNSLMTALLRNSLGGNCITAMIATFSLSADDVEESIQTCRFAERIALIKNQVKLTEIVDPQKEIEMLKKENERLKAQLRLYGNEYITRELNEEEKEVCLDLVTKFIHGSERLDLALFDLRKTEYCFRLMRDEIQRKDKGEELDRQERDKSSNSNSNANSKLSFETIKNYQPRTSSQGQVDLAKITSTMKSKYVDKSWRRKRTPVEMSKLNITYAWKSSEQISDMESNNKTGEMMENDTPDASSSSQLEAQLSTTISQRSKLSTDFGPSQEVSIPTTPSRSVLFPKKEVKETISFRNVQGMHSQYEHDARNQGLCHKSSSEPQGMDAEYMSSSELAVLENFHAAVRKQVHREDQGREIEKEVHYIVSNAEKMSEASINSQISLDCLPLTGDMDVDEEIIKFYKSRYEIFKNK